MVKITVKKSEADTQITGDIAEICAEMIMAVASVYHTLASMHTKEAADRFKAAFLGHLATVPQIWEPPEELIVIDKSKMNGAPTDQS